MILIFSKVHLNAWNHLSVYRHDWGVWIQLNGGKQEEGRSQVREAAKNGLILVARPLRPYPPPDPRA